MPKTIATVRRTEPRVHCWQRRLSGDYVPAASTTTAHLAAVFAAERERLAIQTKPRRRRSVPVVAATQTAIQLQLVA